MSPHILMLKKLGLKGLELCCHRLLLAVAERDVNPDLVQLVIHQPLSSHATKAETVSGLLHITAILYGKVQQSW